MSAAAPLLDPSPTLRRDENFIWAALLNATAAWSPTETNQFLDLDWDLFLSAAKFHGVLPLAAQRVLESDVAHTLDYGGRDKLRRAFQANLVRNVFLPDEITRVCSAFRKARIPIMPYKGPVLAHQLWGSAALRECVDLDFLIERHNVHRASEILIGLGYAPLSTLPKHLRSAFVRNASEEQFRHRESGLLLELQWAPSPRVFALRFEEAPLWEDVREISFNGDTVLAPSPEHLFSLLAVHGWKHNWEKLIWVGDLAKLTLASQLDWGRLLADCRRTHSVRVIGLALRIVNRTFGILIPEPFTFSDPNLDLLSRQLCEHMLLCRTYDYASWHRYMLAARDHHLDRARQLATFFLTPGLAEYAALNLPAWASSGYSLVRLARLIRYGASITT